MAMRILVAVDGSDPSRRAATRSADLARRLGGSLTVVHELERRLCERGKAVLDEMAATLRHDGLEVQAQLLAGPAAEVLADAAQPPEVDFVVVGSRGRTLVGSMLLGGTSHRLIHICKKPVLVVH